MRTPDPPLSHPYKHGGRGVGLYDPTLRPKPVMLVSRNLTSRGTKTVFVASVTIDTIDYVNGIGNEITCANGHNTFSVLHS